MRPEVMVDAFAGLIPGGGIGRYVRDLSAALTGLPGAPPARFAFPRNFRDRARAAYRPERLHELPHPWWRLRLLYTAGTLAPLRFDRMFGEPAVLHSPVGYGPTFDRTRLIDHVHDLTTLEHPEWHPIRANQFLRATIPHAARHASVVLTHSAFIGRRVVEVLGVDPARVVTIPPPLGHCFTPVPLDASRSRVKRRFGLDGEFILHVGTLEPRKNHLSLIGAFERLRRAGFPGPLVLVGQDGWKTRPIQRRIETSPEAGAILRIRDADDRDLAALYGACTACAYPSLEEGFGMPLLESMACGAACVTSEHASLLELGAGCALAVPARDEEALAETLAALWTDPDLRGRVAGPGPARAAAYTFERWAPRIFALYRRELEAAGVAASGVGAVAAPPVRP
ncbi:MAG: glycosyltransferase family 4 protein [Candidatus Eisenbacteria bacterium]|nr:glycosyltransferase family 4 protein [Candidatus Eisenbacteria bacterium]